MTLEDFEPLISKLDLRYRYSWYPYDHDDPRINKPKFLTSVFNRKSGDEVMAMINAVIENFEYKPGVVQEIERKIQEEMPDTILKHADAYKWLLERS